MVGLKSSPNSKRKYNLLTVRQLVHRHLNAFEACLEGRLQLVVLRCIELAWPFFIYDWFILIQSKWFTSVYHFSCFFSLSSWFSVKTSSTDRLPSSSILLAARLTHFSLDFCSKNDVQKLCHSAFLVKCESLLTELTSRYTRRHSSIQTPNCPFFSQTLEIQTTITVGKKFRFQFQ